LALANAGKSIPARMAMMAITTSNSISVNARSGVACGSIAPSRATTLAFLIEIL